MNKKIKPNRYRPEAREETDFFYDSTASIDFCVNCIMMVAAISVLSLASIFAYDFITQSDFFRIKTLDISGTEQVSKEEILNLANLTGNENIFGINLFSIEKLIIDHPWIQSASIKRNLSSVLSISVIEQAPLAIIKIENLTNILINNKGIPFKEYNPQEDQIGNLPVISGLDLTKKNNQYLFTGPLFNAIMDFLKTDASAGVSHINGNKNTGITIDANDIYNQQPSRRQKIVQIKLGFKNFEEKLNKAIKISEYIDKNFPEKTISSMDLFNINKVFIKTKFNDALHHNLEKGV